MKELTNPRINLLADRVAVLPKEVEEVTKGGILLPKALQEDEVPTERYIVSISRQISEEAKEYERVNLGDIVLYSKYAGTAITIDGVEYKVLRLSDVIGVLTPEVAANQ